MDWQFADKVDLETAARLLGVHYQTVYRWVRTGVLPAVKGPNGYRVDRSAIEAVAAQRQAPKPLAYTGRGRDWERLRDQLHVALVAGDDTGARRVFEMVHLARVPLVEQCEQLLTPNMQRIGDEYAAGNLSAARVRVAAGICERTLEWAVGRVERRPSAEHLALVITPKGDDHRLPSLMAGAVLRDGGWAVREVQGLAPSEAADLAERVRPALAVVSVTMSDVADAADEVRTQLSESIGVPVLVGGAGKSLRELVEAAGPAGADITPA